MSNCSGGVDLGLNQFLCSIRPGRPFLRSLTASSLARRSPP